VSPPPLDRLFSPDGSILEYMEAWERYLEAERFRELAQSAWDALPDFVQSSIAEALTPVRLAPAAQAIQGRIDQYFSDAAAKYTVGGAEASVEPFFRRSKGWAPPDGTASPADLEKRVRDATGRDDKAFRRSVHMCAWGRGSPEDVRIVTQALMDAGKLAEVLEQKNELSDDEFREKHGVSRPLTAQQQINLLQWEFGIGIDCAGYVQQAFLDAHGGTRESYGFDPIGEENLYDLEGNPAFDRELTPVHAQPGDLIVLKPPAEDEAGHTLLVRDGREIAWTESQTLDGVETFAQPTDTVHLIEVQASWGAGEGDLEKGGVQQRTFLFNETTGQWADVHDGQVSPQADGPYGGHPVESIYHPKH
jgi:cell wall-associated NlpC family hydrolase